MRSITKQTSTNVSLAAMLIVASIGCRSKIDVHTKEGAPLPKTLSGAPPAPPEVEVANGLTVQAAQVMYQTRGVISMLIDRAVVDGASKFTVLNMTKAGGDENKALVVLKDATPTFGLVSGGDFSLTDAGADKVKISFYPGVSSWKGKFFYGKNTLRVLANNNVAIHYANAEVTLRDFSIFSFASSAFTNGRQMATADGVTNYRYQGWFNSYAPSAVKAKGVTLVHGMFDIINR